MIPNSKQQLTAVRRRLEESIIPQLPADARFAHEQARFILQTIDWLLDTVTHEYRYEVVENADYRALLADMLRRDLPLSAEDQLVEAARSAIGERGPDPAEASIPVADVVRQNRSMKAVAMALYTRISEEVGSAANPLRDLMASIALRQGRREIAFFRQTGWVSTDDELGVLLEESGMPSGVPAN